MIQIDRAFVEQQRAKGFSWAHIARQVGLSEHDVRAQCDRAYPKLYAVSPLPKAAKKPKKAAGAKPVRIPRDDKVMAQLVFANGHCLTAHEIGGHSGQNGISHLRQMYGSNIIETVPYEGYRITEAGREVWRLYFAKAVRVSA